MTTRHHFELVAEIVSKIEHYPDRVAMAQKAARQFTKENKGFNPEVFLDACGISQENHQQWHEKKIAEAIRL